MTLIAEDLLLLLLDDEKGTLAVSSWADLGLGGALLVELALDGSAEVVESSSVWRTAKVHAAGTVPHDPLLAQARERVAEKERSAQDLVGRLGKGVREELCERLESRGILRRERSKVLGLFPRTTWPANDSAHEQTVRADLTRALVEGGEPDERTAGLIAVLHALSHAPKVVDRGSLSNGDIRKRAKEIAEGDWAAKGVKDAINAAMGAIAAGVAASTAATTAATN